MSYSTLPSYQINHVESHDIARDPYTLTLLQAPPGLPQQKVLTSSSAKHPIPPHVWSIHLIRCTRPEQLAQWLTVLEREPSVVLIRGCPNRGQRA